MPRIVPLLAGPHRDGITARIRATRIPRCGGSIAGTIANANQRLAAEEALNQGGGEEG